MLHRACILPVVRELVPACVPQHVRMYRERKLRPVPCPPEHLAIAGRRHRGVPFTVEHVTGSRLLSQQPTQRSNFRTAKRMYARRSIFHPPHVQEPVVKINLIPSQSTQLTRTQQSREHLAIHAAELAVKPCLQFLRRYRRSLLLRLEHAHRSAVENHVQRPPRLGSRGSLNLRIGISSKFNLRSEARGGRRSSRGRASTSPAPPRRRARRGTGR